MEKRFKNIIMMVLILSITGAICTCILAWHNHFGPVYKEYGNKTGIVADLGNIVCGVSDAGTNCSAVEASKYSRPLDIPMTSWGLFYFLMMSFLSAWILFEKNLFRAEFEILLVWWTVLGSIADIILLFIIIFIIKAICPFCLITYLSNWISLALLIICFKDDDKGPLRIRKSISKARSDLKVNGPAKFILFLIPAFLISGYAGLMSDSYLSYKKRTFIKEKEEAIANDVVKEFTKEPRVKLDFFEGPVIGNPDAPMTIVEFSDFLCPYCKSASAVLRGLVYEHPNRIKLVFVNFPLDTACNDCIKEQVHDGSCELAKGAICASMQGKFEKYHEILQELDLKKVGKREMDQIAGYSGLNKNLFNVCMASSVSEKMLRDQIKKGRELEINSTPVVFINGKKFRKKIQKKLLERIILEELKK